jgi:uncharacterized protein
MISKDIIEASKKAGADVKDVNKRLSCRVALSLMMAFLCLPLFPVDVQSLPDQQHGEKTAMIIIDDFGNNAKGTTEIMELPYKVTVAVMPFMPSTEKDAKRAHAAGHDVIVHMPMEALSGKKHWLGPGAITTDLSDAEIQKRVHAAIDNVPHAIGMNNHMGSKATVDERVMRNVLKVCKERGLFFVDSHTNFRSIVGKIASEVQVPSLENHIFLDDVHTKAAVHKQFMLMREHFRRHDVCIAIGHVGAGGRITAEVLKDQMVKMNQENIQFKKVASVLKSIAPR